MRQAEPRGGDHSGSRPRIIHQDEAIVVVEKPVGLPVIAPEGGRGKTVLGFVTEALRRRNPRARAAVVHRLDRDTSGVMVFACDGPTKKRLMDNWSEAARDRRYVALVEGDIAGEAGRLDSWIAEAGPSRMRPARIGERGAQRALGSWTLLARGGGFSLVEVALETGRKHQIRVQFAALGHPVAGDARYGSRSDPCGRLMLHASLLELVHPASGEILRFESPPPPCFSAALHRRRGSDSRESGRHGDHASGEREKRERSSGNGAREDRRRGGRSKANGDTRRDAPKRPGSLSPSRRSPVRRGPRDSNT